MDVRAPRGAASVVDSLSLTLRQFGEIVGRPAIRDSPVALVIYLTNRYVLYGSRSLAIHSGHRTSSSRRLWCFAKNLI